MFTTSLENNVTHVNDRNEYHVADGISATVFRAILVSVYGDVFIVTSEYCSLASFILSDRRKCFFLNCERHTICAGKVCLGLESISTDGFGMKLAVLEVVLIVNVRFNYKCFGLIAWC